MTELSKNAQVPQCDKTTVTSSVYLSLYLPYKAQVFTTQNFHPNSKEKPLIKRATATLTGDLFADIENGVYGGNPFKLMLNPLSNLINGILEDGNEENYNLSCELAELLNTTDCSHFVKALIENKYYAVDVRLWKDIEDWLCKNHFDWKYNLIHNDIAMVIR